MADGKLRPEEVMHRQGSQEKASLALEYAESTSSVALTLEMDITGLQEDGNHRP